VKHLAAAFAGALLLVTPAPASAEPCHPDAIGTSRVMTIDPRRHPRVGTINYARTLPLAPREVVLTFDDGPISPFTDAVLDILAAHCAKATFFVVGDKVEENPALVRRLRTEGHSVATHTQHHPRHLDRAPLPLLRREIESGIATTATALDEPPAPFFRVPGLARTRQIERYLALRNVSIWSGDAVSDDWKPISDREVVRRALAGLERKRGGILLMHDIHLRTVRALPRLLAQLKRHRFRIVHVVAAQRDEPVVGQAGPERPRTKRPASRRIVYLAPGDPRLRKTQPRR
jgi:peptidoglycan/xylan/chitin deacetylase (PgdA/CDA1 family)